MSKILTCIGIIIFTLIMKESEAQENKYSIWTSYIVAPSNLSYQLIYRVDSFNERYKDGTAQGYGFGFSVPAFKIFSPVVTFDFLNRNGIDTHGTKNERVRIKGSRLKLGGSFHLKRNNNPYIDLNIGFIRNRFTATSRYFIYEEYRQTGYGRGMYLGPGILFEITSHSVIKLEMNAAINGTDFENNPNYGGSGEISQFIALNIEFNISYVFRF